MTKNFRIRTCKKSTGKTNECDICEKWTLQQLKEIILNWKYKYMNEKKRKHMQYDQFKKRARMTRHIKI